MGQHAKSVIHTELINPKKAARSRRRRLLFAVAGLLSVIVLFMVGLSIALAISERARDQSSSNLERQANVAPEGLASFNEYIANGDLDKAAQEIKDNPALQNTDEGKLAAANLAFEQQNYKKAVEYYVAINNQTPSVYDLLARSHAALGNKNQAISYYELQVKAIEKGDDYPLMNADIAYIRERIKELQ